MIRVLVLAMVAVLLVGCRRARQNSVSIAPSATQLDPEGVPGDPFGSASAAYLRLREVTDAALSMPWSGELETLAPWLEEQTVAVERSLALLKAIRTGPQDVYAVANGRIAMVYEHIASALTEASKLAERDGYDAEWRDQQDLIWDQATAFWIRCVRACGTSGPHLDAWDLRCRTGLANAEQRPTRQPK